MWNDFLYEDYCGEQPKVNTGLTTQADDDDDDDDGWIGFASRMGIG